MTPFAVDDLHCLVSNGGDGTRCLLIFNNEGNVRNIDLGNVIDHRADRRVKVTFKDKANLQIIRSFCDGIKLEKTDDMNWYVTVLATEMVILTF